MCGGSTMIGNTVGMGAHAGVENCTKKQKGENTNGNKKKVSACKFWCLIVCVKVTSEIMKDKVATYTCCFSHRFGRLCNHGSERSWIHGGGCCR